MPSGPSHPMDETRWPAQPVRHPASIQYPPRWRGRSGFCVARANLLELPLEFRELPLQIRDLRFQTIHAGLQARRRLVARLAPLGDCARHDADIAGGSPESKWA